MRHGRWRSVVTVLAALLIVAGAGVHSIATAESAAPPPASADANEAELAKSFAHVSEFYDQGKFAEGLAAAQQALQFSEQRFGQDHQHTAEACGWVGIMLRELGRYPEAEPFFKRALSLSEKNLGADNGDTAQAVNNLALLYRIQGRHAEAEPLIKRALAIREKALGPESPDVAESLDDLGSLYIFMGRLGEVEPLFKRALAIREKALGEAHARTAQSLSNLAYLYRAQARFREAEPLQIRAVAAYEKALGVDSPSTALAVGNLGQLYLQQGRYGEALPLFQRALATTEKVYGPEHADTAKSVTNVAAFYQAQGKHAEAEPLFRRALAIFEKALGPEHTFTANALTNLAGLYQEQSRYGEAEPLLRRAIAVQEKLVGPDGAGVALSLGNLATVLQAQGHLPEAEALFKRAIANLEKGLGPEHPSLAQALGNLVSLYIEQRRYGEAEPLAQRGLAIREKALGPEHPDTGASISNLARLNILQGRYDVAVPLLHRQIAIFEKALPADHPWIGRASSDLSFTLQALGRTDEALAAARKSLKLLSNRKAAAAAAQRQGGARGETSYDASFVQFVRAAYAATQAKPQDEASLRAEALEGAQWVGLGSTSRAISQMAARFAAGDSELAKLLREQQDLLLRLPALDTQIARAQGSRDQTTRAQADVLIKESEAVSARLSVIDRTLRETYKDYADLVDPRPVPVAQLQALLDDDEAAVLLLIGKNDSYLFAVTRAQVTWAKASLTSEELDASVLALRRSLDPKTWAPGTLKPFDRKLAFKLYQQLWAPLEAVLQDKKRVFVVPTGALTSLPLSVLVTSAPQGGDAGDADPQALRDTAWLIKRHALVTLPSLSSLKMLRRYAGRVSGDQPFAGFGDPILGDGRNEERGAPTVAASFRGVSPDQTQLRQLGRLSGAEGELKALARALGASQTQDVCLRECATKLEVQRRDLSHKRVLAFSTHGLMAGELGMGEPGLVFTLPTAPNTNDNGYLTASEVAQLKLSADWIILSACNTAAGEKPGAEGLSGLARAFFLAGAKSLLVSHWQVWDDAATRLTTGAVTHLQSHAGEDRAEALRQSMLALMSDPTERRFAHPAAWAAFVIVGETRTGSAR